MAEHPTNNLRERLRPSRPYLRPFGFVESWLEWLKIWLERWALFDVLDRVSKISVAVAVVLWITECPDRQTQARLRAWQVLVDAEGSKTRASGGRIEALEFLNRQRVKLTGMDLQEAYLPALDLRNAILDGANFNRAVLNDAHLDGARLTRASLEEAVLNCVSLRGADLNHARLKGARFGNIRDEDIVSTKYKEGDQQEGRGGRHISVEFTMPLGPEADLTNAILFSADLTGADLGGARLDGADLRLARLKDAKFLNASLSGAVLMGADLSGADFSDADLLGAVGLTQHQIASAKGTTGTRLPTGIVTPPEWPPRDPKTMPPPWFTAPPQSGPGTVQVAIRPTTSDDAPEP